MPNQGQTFKLLLFITSIFIFIGLTNPVLAIDQDLIRQKTLEAVEQHQSETQMVDDRVDSQAIQDQAVTDSITPLIQEKIFFTLFGDKIKLHKIFDQFYLSIHF